MIFSAHLRWIFFLLIGVLSVIAAPVFDNSRSLQTAITAAYHAGQKVFVIPPGTYRLAPEKPGNPCLAFSKLRDFEIDATGVEMVCTDRMSGGIVFHQCEGVTLKGLTMRHDPLPFSQGKVEAIHPDTRSLDVRIAAGFPSDLDDGRYFSPSGFLNVFDPATRLWKQSVADIGYRKITRLGPDLFRFSVGDRPSKYLHLAVGDLIAWRGTGKTDITLAECAQMKMLDLRFENAIGFCIHEDGGEGGSYYRYTVTRGPAPTGATEGPLFASNADAFHSSNVRHGPTLENCLFEYMDDDGIPIHGAYSVVVATEGQKVTLAILNREFCRPGDTLKFYDEKGVYRGTAKAAQLELKDGYVPPPGYQGDLHSYADPHRVLFADLSLTPALAVQPGWQVANTDATGNGFVVRHCTIRNNRARGILIKASNGVIEDCTVEGTTMAGIAFWPDISYWSESDFVHDIVIKNNVLRNVAIWDEGWNPAAGALTIGANEGAGFVSSPEGHNHILIEGNRFENDAGVNVLVSTARDVRIEGNIFSHPMNRPSGRGAESGVDSRSLIWLAHCSGVQLKDNWLENPGPDFAKMVTDRTNGDACFEAGITRRDQ